MSIEQLRQLFALESQDTLQQIEDSLLLLESTPHDAEAIKVLFRGFHTIKGSAGVVGLERIANFTHLVENLLDKVRNGKTEVSPDLIRVLLGCRDLLAKLLDNVSDGLDDSPDLATTEQVLRSQLEMCQRGEVISAIKIMPPSAAPVEAPTLPRVAPVLPTSGIRPDKLFHVFMEEAREALARMARALDEWSQATTPSLEPLLPPIQTLKGAANLVGEKQFARFAQQLETELQRWITAVLPLNEDAQQLLRDCHQHITEQLNAIAPHPPGGEQFGVIPPHLQSAGELLVQQLRAFIDAAPSTLPIGSSGAMPVAQPATPVRVIKENEPVMEDGNWHISLRFAQDALINGVEPLASLRYLAEHGKIASLATLYDAMPQPEDMNPDACYLGFEITFKSEHQEQEEIEGLFDLVRDYCEVRILPPRCQLAQYVQLLRELPEDPRRVGEILLESGELTRQALDEGLAQVVRVPPRPHTGESVQPMPEDMPGGATFLQPQTIAPRQAARKTLHVDAQKLDQLINSVGELVIANAGINLLVQDSNNNKLKEAAFMMSRLVEDIRNSTLSMRMVQIGNTFNRFRRLVHDISQDLGKQIDLVINGAETELDKSMVEKINDPLTHLVRNAIDHGIEPEAERLAAGKPALGTVQLNAYHDSGSIVIEVGDDGRGLNRQAILAAAIKNGLIKPSQELTGQEIDNLIFEPNLSTAKTITQLSGRGVGLDVVKRNINALNGTVEVRSWQGKGTAIQIFLPLTLAIIDGFLLSVQGSAFVVPLDRVVECVELSTEISARQDTGYINLRGNVLPLLYLSQLFALQGAETPRAHEGRRQNVVVVHYGNQQAGFVVDGLLGEFQAVIKPLGKLFEKLSGISGATILGNGEVALILDVPELVKRYANKRQTAHASARDSSQRQAAFPLLATEA